MIVTTLTGSGCRSAFVEGPRGAWQPMRSSRAGVILEVKRAQCHLWLRAPGSAAIQYGDIRLALPAD